MSLCIHCNVHPRYSGHPFCGKTCARAAASARDLPAAAAAYASTSTPAIGPAGLCIQCHAKPKYPGHKYCGKKCAWAAAQSPSGYPYTNSAGNCIQCRVRPKYPGHEFCGKTCAAANLGFCMQCRVKPQWPGHPYCGKTCARAAKGLPPQGNTPSVLKIVTPLRADIWEQTLTSLGLINRFRELPDLIRHGFPLGVSSPVRETYIPENARSARDLPQVIEDHIAKEVDEGRYTGPFTKSQLESLIGPFTTTPLVAVEKDTPGEYRIVQDFNRSIPKQPSVNTQTDTAKFTFEWGYFEDVAKIVRDAPPGTQAALFDVEAAYRRIPIRPEDQPHAVISWNDKFWIDHAAAFGARSSGGNWGKVADALAEVYRAKGIRPIKKWVDDFCFFRYLTPGTSRYPYDESHIKSIAKELGVPWKETKTRPFSSTFQYLGFDWDLEEKTVGIPEEKCSDFLDTLRPWSDAKNDFTRPEAEALRGKLTHCCLALPSARCYLPALTRFIADYENHSEKRYPSAELRRDINFWINTLSSPKKSRESIAPPPPPSRNKIYVDAASSWGIGVIVGGEWYNWSLKRDWEQDGRGMGWAEMVAVELGLKAAISRGERNVTFSMYSDNTGVIHAFEEGRARNPQENRVLQRIVRTLMTTNTNLTLTYVNTGENPADLPARGKPPRGNLRRREFPFTMPSALKGFFVL